MDLKAYVQIPDLKDIAKKNNINVSRVRGYRLMKDEQIISREDIKAALIHMPNEIIREVVAGDFQMNPDCLIYSYGKNKYYWVDNNYTSHVKWNNIHGKKRRILKYHIKKAKQNYLKQMNMWNKYVGRDDVLYIHAKLGNTNWSGVYHDDYQNEDWYLDSITDWWDSAYCDIFAYIKKEK